MSDFLEKLKGSVYQANIDLVKHGLVILTFGNASTIWREEGLVIIKPSGVSYETMTASDMVVIDLEGKIIEGKLNPSSDTPTHLELYKKFPTIGGIVHTHSSWATIWAQSGKSIPVQGTTHADHFYGNIPCTRAMLSGEIKSDYEKNTGSLIVESMGTQDPLDMPAVLVNNHGPFTFGKDVSKAVINAVVLEEVAKTAYHTHQLGQTNEISRDLLDKHFMRKHGPGRYYGQK
jgi:L-ribulose-5-phosphate 4-epimerase